MALCSNYLTTTSPGDPRHREQHLGFLVKVVQLHAALVFVYMCMWRSLTVFSPRMHEKVPGGFLQLLLNTWRILWPHPLVLFIFITPPLSIFVVYQGNFFGSLAFVALFGMKLEMCQHSLCVSCVGVLHCNVSVWWYKLSLKDVKETW